MSTFSNFGPPDDGRIKPDVSAKGVDVNSTVSTSNSAYDFFSGTSMATPAITGMVTLLQQHYNNLNASYMRAASVRGLICHTAREAGNYPGPDYEFGWGLADAQAAASVISGKGVSTVLEERTLANLDVLTKQVSLASTQNLTATICWTDPVGTANTPSSNDNRTARLKNNLDLKVLKDGVTYYPWKLNYDDVFAGATNDSDNNVDNVERIDIPDAAPGVYTIEVRHKGTLVGGSQNYTLIVSAPAGIALATNSYDFDRDIAVYPNPAKSQLNIATPHDTPVTHFEVYDIVGKRVLASQPAAVNSFDVSTLSKGVYFAKFIFEGESVTKKFMVD
jgi:subtilisin family serine protease